MRDRVGVSVITTSLAYIMCSHNNNNDLTMIKKLIKTVTMMNGS